MPERSEVPRTPTQRLDGKIQDLHTGVKAAGYRTHTMLDALSPTEREQISGPLKEARDLALQARTLGFLLALRGFGVADETILKALDAVEGTSEVTIDENKIE